MDLAFYALVNKSIENWLCCSFVVEQQSQFFGNKNDNGESS